MPLLPDVVARWSDGLLGRRIEGFTLIQEWNFPTLPVDITKTFVMSTHSHFLEEEDEQRVWSCFQRHLSRDQSAFTRGPIRVSPEIMLAFLKDLLKAEHAYGKTLLWTGYMICLSQDSRGDFITSFYLSSDRRGKSVPLHADNDRLVAMAGMDPS